MKRLERYKTDAEKMKKSSKKKKLCGGARTKARNNCFVNHFCQDQPSQNEPAAGNFTAFSGIFTTYSTLSITQHLVLNKNHRSLGICCLLLWLSCILL